MLDRTRIAPELAGDLIDTAHAVAEAARRETLRYFRAPSLSTRSKSEDFDPVTAADLASERAMRDVLAQRRPDDGILGEEEAQRLGTSGLTWVLDPIDGTRGFISGTPTWGVLIALSDADGPFFGMIDQPYIGERFVGGLGLSEMSGPSGSQALGVRAESLLANATLFTTFPEVGTPEEGAAFQRVAHAAKLTRYGCDCYAYALLAAGQIDLVIEAGLHPYDIQAPIAVIEAAGGIVTDWTGGPAHLGGVPLPQQRPSFMPPHWRFWRNDGAASEECRAPRHHGGAGSCRVRSAARGRGHHRDRAEFAHRRRRRQRCLGLRGHARAGQYASPPLSNTHARCARGAERPAFRVVESALSDLVPFHAR